MSSCRRRCVQTLGLSWFTVSQWEIKVSYILKNSVFEIFTSLNIKGEVDSAVYSFPVLEASFSRQIIPDDLRIGTAPVLLSNSLSVSSVS